MYKFKVIMISNFNYSVVPITNNSIIESKSFVDFHTAKKYAIEYTNKSYSNYAKIINIATNEMLYESKK